MIDRSITDRYSAPSVSDLPVRTAGAEGGGGLGGGVSEAGGGDRESENTHRKTRKETGTLNPRVASDSTSRRANGLNPSARRPLASASVSSESQLHLYLPSIKRDGI